MPDELYDLHELDLSRADTVLADTAENDITDAVGVETTAAQVVTQGDLRVIGIVFSLKVAAENATSTAALHEFIWSVTTRDNLGAVSPADPGIYLQGEGVFVPLFIDAAAGVGTGMNTHTVVGVLNPQLMHEDAVQELSGGQSVTIFVEPGEDFTNMDTAEVLANLRVYGVDID